MKNKETLEEAAERTEFERYGQTLTNYTKQRPAYNLGFNNGTKWQQEQDKNKYSEEDLKQAFNVGFNVGYNDETSPSYLTFEKWFEQFKNK